MPTISTRINQGVKLGLGYAPPTISPSGAVNDPPLPADAEG